MIAVGFTGTRTGMTEPQRDSVTALLSQMLSTYSSLTAHHGDCLGADADFHALCLSLSIPIHIHPPSDERMRAFCTGAELVHDPLEYMDRNMEIVRASDRLIACPAEPVEQRHGGTWSTIRKARRHNIKRAIIEPDGFVRIEEAGK